MRRSRIWQPSDGQGLVLYLPMLEGGGTQTRDFTPNGNHGSIIGASWDTNLKFDGIDDYINITTISTSKTQMGWFNFTQLASVKGGNNQLFSNLYQHAANNFIYLTGSADFFDVSIIINKWYHIAMTNTTLNDATTAKLYLNGVAYNISLQSPPHPIDSISTISRATEAFSGHIKQIRIYNRALTAAEIKDHAQN